MCFWCSSSSLVLSYGGRPGPTRPGLCLLGTLETILSGLRHLKDLSILRSKGTLFSTMIVMHLRGNGGKGGPDKRKRGGGLAGRSTVRTIIPAHRRRDGSQRLRHTVRTYLCIYMYGKYQSKSESGIIWALKIIGIVQCAGAIKKLIGGKAAFGRAPMGHSYCNGGLISSC